MKLKMGDRICQRIKTSPKNILCLLLTFFGWFCMNVRAQDLHHSPFWMNPVSVNPASAGFFNGDLRVGTYHRNQWLSVTTPYQTSGFWADAPLHKRTVQQDILGGGLNVDMDRAGDARYRTLQANASLSYTKALNRKNSHFLSLGGMFGFAQKQLNIDELMHDDQYNGGKYHPEIPTQENYPSSSFSYADMGLGLQWFYSLRSGVNLTAGFSALHLNRPPQSLMKDESIRLPIKYTGLFSLQMPLGGEESFLRPSLYFCRQDVYAEIMAGLIASYAFHFDSKGYVNSLVGGINYRLGDALYVVAGGKWRSFQLIVSYDFNVSSLRKASNGRGGLEVNLQYTYKKPRALRRHKIPCPIF